jgi:geranylgeranylglycerol-phosphate geranylgeranyltransferase
MERAGAFVRLIRPLNCAMMGFAVLIGVVLTGISHLNALWLDLLGFLTGLSLTAASMVMNDYNDREIDSVNEPRRPIPSGVVKPGEALTFAGLLTVVGILAAYFTNFPNPWCFLTAIIACFVFVAYTTVGKRSGLPGNFLVSTCVAIPFIYGSIVATSFVKLNVLVFAFIAFLSNTGREITKGIVDVQGDRLRNVKTLAVRYGDKTAAASAVFFYLFAITLSPIPWLIGLVSVWFIPFVVITDSGLLACSFMLLRDYSRENSRRVKNNVLLLFIFGLLAFVAGAFG